MRIVWALFEDFASALFGKLLQCVFLWWLQRKTNKQRGYRQLVKTCKNFLSTQLF